MLCFKSKAPHFKMHFFSLSIVLNYVVFKLQYVFVHSISHNFRQINLPKQTCDPYLLASYYSCGHLSCRAIRTTLCSVCCFPAAWRERRIHVPCSAPSESLEVLLGRVGRRRKTSLFTESTFLRLNVPAPELGILL